MRYAPLFLHSFVPCVSHSGYAEIQNVPDRLRWCRNSKGLLQTEVAEKVGMSISVYKAIEGGITQRIQRGEVEKLAQLYGVPVTDLLDEFNRFLYDGQADRIRAYRESTGLGKKTFAREMGIPIRSLQAWESGAKTISVKSWERYFKGRA